LFSSYVVLDGLRSFNANRAAVRIDQADHVTVRNGVFGNNATWGIFTDFSDDLLLENNECYASGTQHGIYVSNSGDRPVQVGSHRRAGEVAQVGQGPGVHRAARPDDRHPVAERFHLDAPGWFQSSDEVHYLELLAGAVWEAQRVQISYRRGERAGTVERTIEPLGLVLKGGVWYVVARTADSIRTYRVSRVLEATLLEERFVRPEGFDLATHWEESRTAYERGVERINVLVRLPADQLSHFGDAAGDRAMADSSRSTDPGDPELTEGHLARPSGEHDQGDGDDPVQRDVRRSEPVARRHSHDLVNGASP